MAYTATVTIVEQRVNRRNRIRIRVVETEAATGSAWSTTASASNPVTVNGNALAVGDSYKLPATGDIRDLICDLVGGTGTTIQPRLGKAASWSDGTLNEVLTTGPATGYEHAAGPVPYTHDAPFALHGASQANNAAADHTIHTQLTIDEVR